ncbi:tyrosine-protein phosphatase [Pseudarthrobacter sulfonivorans]|uniref:tyrosine-protein phosphatase n=1 Tax=Pseudarthrobacter sulfonivorans TaxID=121292 RepID=UPI00285D48BE|nr:tyrosine-protein phosphatase [Pseudarthrobacter sulfonivorans]MDR6417489.1 protein-tyrosine phosphatase [Pseudarthrobacter sulfonivorans]
MLGRNEGAQGSPVPGLYNLRSTGIWKATGGIIAPGRLYRSDSPARLDAAGAAALGALGIDLIIDLRSAEEVETASYELPGIQRTGIPVELLNPTAALTTEQTLGALYESFIDRYGPRIITALRTIARHDEGAVLVHCTAGKDRTGIVIALALLAVGTPRAEVIRDYAVTHANLKGAWTKMILESLLIDVTSLPNNVREIVNGSPAPILEALLDRLDLEHGGAVGYLRSHGFDDDDFNALRARLVTATAATSEGTS